MYYSWRASPYHMPNIACVWCWVWTSSSSSSHTGGHYVISIMIMRFVRAEEPIVEWVANSYHPYEWSSFSPGGHRPLQVDAGWCQKGEKCGMAKEEFRCFWKEGPLVNVLVTFWESCHAMPCHAMPPSSPNFHPCYQIEFHPIMNFAFVVNLYISIPYTTSSDYIHLG